MERMALENVFAMVNVSGDSEEQSGEEQASSSSTTSSSSSTITSSASSFPTTSSSVYHTVQSASGSRGSSSSSVYYSAPVSSRIQSMIENRSNFSSETDFDIEYSRDHWSELTDSDTDNASTRLANRQHFDKLKEHPEWGGFFKDVKVELGEKINEGGQAEIFDAIVEFEDGRKSPGYGYHVVKVMKGDCPLQDFQRQWPVGMLCNASKDRVKGPLMWIQGGTLVDDRFAFVMLRQWGDLRKLIDTKMQLNNNQGPPFANTEFVKKVMLCIARDMDTLHRNYKIVHRDLKASNVLLWSFGEQLPDDNPHVKANVVDYECSVGVVGTGFWRAPEILEQVKNRIPSSEIVFSYMSDVYSYGMMCYELLTGRTPFEGQSSRDYDFVLNGNRPSLSKAGGSYDYLLIVHCIKRCWSHDPLLRPSFSELVNMLESFNCTEDELQFKVSKVRQDKADIVMKHAELERTTGEGYCGVAVEISRILPVDKMTCIVSHSEQWEKAMSRIFGKETNKDYMRSFLLNQLRINKVYMRSSLLNQFRMISIYDVLDKGDAVRILERCQARIGEELLFFGTLIDWKQRESESD